METKEKQPRSVPTNTKEQARYLQQILSEIGDKDLFPNKTANARKIFEKLNESQQKLIDG